MDRPSAPRAKDAPVWAGLGDGADRPRRSAPAGAVAMNVRSGSSAAFLAASQLSDRRLDAAQRDHGVDGSRARPRRPPAGLRPARLAPRRRDVRPRTARDRQTRMSEKQKGSTMAATLKLRHRAIGVEVRRGTYEVVLDGERVGSLELNGSIEMPVEPKGHTLQVRSGRNSFGTAGEPRIVHGTGNVITTRAAVCGGRRTRKGKRPSVRRRR